MSVGWAFFCDKGACVFGVVYLKKNLKNEKVYEEKHAQIKTDERGASLRRGLTVGYKKGRVIFSFDQACFRKIE